MTTIGVFAAIFDEHQRILCVRRAYGPKNWSTPGGKMEPNETPTQALVREVREETGYIVAPGKLVGVYSTAYQDDLVIFLEAIMISRDRWEPNEEISECAFFSRNELPQPMKVQTRRRVIDAFRGLTGQLHEWTEDPNT